jgi:hypothetical protein
MIFKALMSSIFEVFQVVCLEEDCLSFDVILSCLSNGLNLPWCQPLLVFILLMPGQRSAIKILGVRCHRAILVQA